MRLDLAGADARRTLLNEVAAQSQKVLVLTEAVTPYLSEDAVASFGADLGAHESIGYWIVDYYSPASYECRRRSGMSKSMENAPFLFEPTDYFGLFLRIGWKPKEIRYFATEAERLRRPAPFPLVTRIVMRTLGFFASLVRRQEMIQYAGFVLFEPGKTEQRTAMRNHDALREHQLMPKNGAADAWRSVFFGETLND